MYRCLTERWGFTPEEINRMSLPQVYSYVATGKDGSAILEGSTASEKRRMALYHSIKARDETR